MVNLLTGGQYCNFSLEQDAMLRQIVSSPPLPLSELGLAGLEGVEQVLFRHFQKTRTGALPAWKNLQPNSRLSPGCPAACAYAGFRPKYPRAARRT